MMTSTTTTTKCARCNRTGVTLQCSECKKALCNLHFCDVCRHCGAHCKCWGKMNHVYHPPKNEPPPH